MSVSKDPDHDDGLAKCPLKIGLLCSATPEIKDEACNGVCPFYNDPYDAFCRSQGYHSNARSKHMSKEVIA